MQQASCNCLNIAREVRRDGVSLFWRDRLIISKHCQYNWFCSQLASADNNQHHATNPKRNRKRSTTACSRLKENMLMLKAPECNHNELIKKDKENLFQSPLSLQITQIQCHVQINWLSCYADVFISFPSLSTSFSRPSLAGEKRACCVGWLALEFLSCTASISHPGWWMRRTSGSGGWKRPHIGL